MSCTFLRSFWIFHRGFVRRLNRAPAALIGAGGHADLALEDAAEIRAVGEANGERDLGDALLPSLQQCSRLFDAVAREVRDRRNAHLAMETIGEVVLVHADTSRELLARERLGIM